MRRPYTREDLDRLLPALKARLEERIAQHEAEFAGARPLMPLTVQEALGYFHRLIGVAGERALSREECALHGQLLAVLISAARAEGLSLKGRCFVMTEDEILAQVRAAFPE